MADNDNTTIPDTDGGGGEAPPETTRHEDIERAFEQVETRDAPPPPAPGVAAPAPAAAPPGAPPGERARDPATGRFAPGAPAAAPPKPDAALGKQPAAPAPKPAAAPAQRPPEQAAPPAAAPQSRAPVSWKPAAREHWAKLPPEVQQEVSRRETEVARSMQESASARNALQHVQSVLAPYAHNIAATGQDALQMIHGLFNADNVLRHGSMGDRAQMVAGIIKSYGVDIVTLDRVLAGQQPEADPNAQLAERLRQEMNQQLQPVMQYFGQLQGQRQQAFQQINQTAGTEVQAFGQDEAHEFFEDVREDMADIIDLFTARGQSISLQEAYDRAIKINPQVSELLGKRAEAERASAQAAAAQRARRTAASITSAPAPAGVAPGPVGDSRRADIEAAWEGSSGS